MLDAIERHPSETVHAQMLEADLAVTRATATVVAISARLPIRPPGMSNTCRGPPGLALLGQSVHGHIGDRLGHARVHDDGHTRGKKTYKNRRLTDVARGPCGSGACDIDVSSDTVTIAPSTMLIDDASYQGDPMITTRAKKYKNMKLPKASRSSSAALALLLALRWLQADLVDFILFGRRMLASKYSIANLRTTLSVMMTRFPSLNPGSVLEFTKASAAGPRELRLGWAMAAVGMSGMCGDLRTRLYVEDYGVAEALHLIRDQNSRVSEATAACPIVACDRGRPLPLAQASSRPLVLELLQWRRPASQYMPTKCSSISGQHVFFCRV